MLESSKRISGENTSIIVHALRHTHILDHHLICTGTRGISTAWLQLFHSGSGYTAARALTKGTTPRQTNTRGQRPLTAPCPPAGNGLRGIIGPRPPKKSTRLLKLLNDAHLSRKLSSQSESCTQEMRESASATLCSAKQDKLQQVPRRRTCGY